jgi:hypothetical protein
VYTIAGFLSTKKSKKICLLSLTRQNVTVGIELKAALGQMPARNNSRAAANCNMRTSGLQYAERQPQYADWRR